MTETPALGTRNERLASYGFLGLGVALRVLQYASNPALWLDEAMLSESIVTRDAVQLLREPLLNDQSAPPGYLLIERALVVALGNHDWVLRLLPFVSSLVALLAVWKLSQHLLRGIARPVAVGLAATAAPLLLFAGQAKQYSSDVAVATLLLLLGVWLEREQLSLRRALLASVAGLLAPWLSLPAVFTLLAVLAASAFGYWRRGLTRVPRRELVLLALLAAVWGVSALGALRFNQSQVTPEMLRYLYEYWQPGFLPKPPPWSATLLWPIKALARPFYGTESAGLYYPLRGVFVLCLLAGFVRLARALPRGALLLGAPIALALLGGIARQYPFADRLVLFLVPNLLLGVAAGLGWASELASARFRPAGLALVGGVCALGFYPGLVPPPPYAAENIKPLLARLAAERRPDQPLYVFCYGQPSFRLYALRGQAPGDFVAGGCETGTRRLLSELDAFRGKPRVWVLVTHALPAYFELEDIRGYLDALGTRLDEQVIAARGPARSSTGALPATLLLYDLSDVERARGVSAATFPIRGRERL